MNEAMGLARATCSEVGVDPAGVHHLLDGLARRGIEVHSLVFARHGRVFAAGAFAPHSLSDAPLLYSLSKTFTSAAVGIAVGDGAFSYEDRLIDLFSDVVGEAGPVASRILVRDCLAMATGHTTDVVPTVSLAKHPGRAPWGIALAQEPEGQPGSTFTYNQFATWTLAEIVRHATGRTVLELLNERVFGPLGITGATWDTDQQGRLLGYSGLHLPPEGIASFFQLLADDGVRNGERLLPVEWISRHRVKQVESGVVEDPGDWAAGYGWQAWMNARGGYRGDGAFGQFGIVLPHLDAVLVLTERTTRMQEVLDEVWASLIPAFDRPATASEESLVERLAGAHLPTVVGDRGAHVHLSYESRSSRWLLRDDHDGWTLRWVDSDGGDNTIPVGQGHWRHGTMRWGNRTLRVAASGAWVEWGHWVGHIMVLDAPHALLVRLREDGSGHAEWVESAPLGNERLASLAH